MKKHLIAFAVVGTFGLPAIAQDATSVTLYGVTDVALARASNVDGRGVTLIDSGRNMSSRFGFRGTEDLGGGLSTIFAFEAGFSMVTGAASTPFFNRQSWLGMSSKTFGTLTVGRQYTPFYDHFILLSGAPTFGVSGGAVDGVATPGSSAARFDNTIGGSRLDNSMKYTSPVMSGFKVNAMYTFADVTGVSAASQVTSAGIGYNQGAINSGLAIQFKKCSAVTQCTATQGEDRLVAAGAAYKFGVATVAAIYSSQTNAKNVLGNDGNVFHMMVNVPVGAWTLSAGMQTLDDKSKLNQDIKQLNLSAVYALTKRTRLYSFYSSQSVENGGKASMAVSNSSDGEQTQFSMGITHLF